MNMNENIERYNKQSNQAWVEELVEGEGKIVSW